jgi:hypothetical protein
MSNAVTETIAMRVSTAVIVSLAFVSSFAVADSEQELQIQIERTYALNVLAQRIFAAYIDGQCGQYAPSQIRTSLAVVESYLVELESRVNPKVRVLLKNEMESDEVREFVAATKKQRIDDVLTHNANLGVNPALSCGMVLASIIPALKDAENERKRLLEVFAK